MVDCFTGQCYVFLPNRYVFMSTLFSTCDIPKLFTVNFPISHILVYACIHFISTNGRLNVCIALLLFSSIAVFLFVLQPSSQYGRLDSYTKLEELGEGSYATVYKAISR